MAFVVEDGTGKTNANAYITVAEANSYISDYARADSGWDALNDATCEGHILEATQTLDLLYAHRFVGIKQDKEQALAFPRYGAYDRDGYAISAK